MDPDNIRQQFLNWVAAPRVDTGSPPPDRYVLYRNFLGLAEEAGPFWTSLAMHAEALDKRRQHQLPWLFMAAVQYLALIHPNEQLARYFPASHVFASGLSSATKEARSTFYDFVRRREDEIWHLVRTRNVQINKLGRLSLFAPLFLEVARRMPAPLAFVDVGCSVGLGLLWPYFGYLYPDHGKITAPCEFDLLNCEIYGVPSVPLAGALPDPVFLAGIEISPLSVSSESDMHWLRALTAPNDIEGRESLALGLNSLAKVKPDIRAGNVLDVLPELESLWPKDANLIVYHAMTMHHLRESNASPTDNDEDRFHRMLARLSQQRRVYNIGVEWTTLREPIPVVLDEWSDGTVQHWRIGETDPSADGRYLRFI